MINNEVKHILIEVNTHWCVIYTKCLMIAILCGKEIKGIALDMLFMENQYN